MKKSQFIWVTAFMMVIGSYIALSQDKEEAHEHGKEETHEQGKEDEHDHGKEEAHEHGKEDEHGHGDEEGHSEVNNVGPDKGVLEANEESGFKLRPEVEVNFQLKQETLSSGSSWNFPKNTIVYSQKEYQVFRKRDGFWKAVDVSIEKKSDSVTIKSKDLRSGDSIATEGNGFLKIIEQSVFGPAIEGHVH
jgi:hypothetical protein